jgi:hypothetical protein
VGVVRAQMGVARVARRKLPVRHGERASERVPASLENIGEILLPEHMRKDKAGHALVRKLTVPKNPSKARKPAAVYVAHYQPPLI